MTLALSVKSTQHFTAADGAVVTKATPWLARVTAVQRVFVKRVVLPTPPLPPALPVRDTASVDFTAAATTDSVIGLVSEADYVVHWFFFGVPPAAAGVVFPSTRLHHVAPGLDGTASATNLCNAINAVINNAVVSADGGDGTPIVPPDIIATNPSPGRVVITNRLLGGLLEDGSHNWSGAGPTPIGNFVITPFLHGWVDGTTPPPINHFPGDVPTSLPVVATADDFPVHAGTEAVLAVAAGETLLAHVGDGIQDIWVSEVELVTPVVSAPGATASDIEAAAAAIVAAVNAAAVNEIAAGNAAAIGVEGVVNAAAATTNATINAAAATVVAAIAAADHHGH